MIRRLVSVHCLQTSNPKSILLFLTLLNFENKVLALPKQHVMIRRFIFSLYAISPGSGHPPPLLSRGQETPIGADADGKWVRAGDISGGGAQVRCLQKCFFDFPRQMQRS